MKIDGIVVTGVGGGVGQSVLKCLQGTGYRVIAVDGLADATGLYAVNRAYVGEYANSDRFIDRLLEICRNESANVIFPGLDAELIPLARNKELFDRHGIKVIVGSNELVAIADDKFLTAKFLKDHGFFYPQTETALGQNHRFPVIVKPRQGGARSSGVIKCDNQQDLERAVNCSKNLVIQECIEGEEYTCGTLSANGVCYGVIPMKRSLRNGDTYKAYVENNPVIIDYVCKVIETLRPDGPCNVQLRYKDGRCYIFEFNARCSGTSAARAMAGFNEPLWLCRGIETGIYEHLRFKEMAIFRYWKEFAVDIEDFQNMSVHKQIVSQETRQL